MTIAADAIATFSADDWTALRARIGDVPPAVRMPDADILTLAVPVPRAGATRAAVAGALVGRTPVALARLCWGHKVQDDGTVRVAMAHGDRVAALIATLHDQGIAPGAVLADGIAIVRGDGGAVRSDPLWLLAAIPVLTAIGGWVLAGAGEARIARLQPLAAARAAGVAAEARATAVFARPAIGELLARLDLALPPSATLHAIGGDADGAVAVEIDTADPVVLRGALAGDPVLARLRTVAQAPVADSGIRIALRIDRP